MPHAVCTTASHDHRSARSTRTRTGRALGLVVAVTLATVAAGCSSSPSTPAVKGPTISIASLSFSPATLTVAPGATVTVVNNDQVSHNVASSSGAFRTANLSPGQSTTFRAPTDPGRYAYTCTLHPFMRGTLVVR